MAKNRATQVTKQKRLDLVIEMLGRGKMRYQIVNEMMDEWKMSQSGVIKYLNVAYQLLKAAYTDEDIIAAYKSIYNKTYDDSPALALKAMDSISKMKKDGFSQIIPNIITIKFDGENEELKSN
jgi:hypothetical protein